MRIRPRTIITHNGSFHADDVFAVALLLVAQKGQDFKVIRSRDLEALAEADIVVDVGREYKPEEFRFDHHQEGGAGVRPNGIPYASFGLVWKRFSKDLCSSRVVAEIVDEKLVAPIDAMDNGIQLFELTNLGLFPYLIQDLVVAFQPTWKEEGDLDSGFMKLVGVAKEILEREITQAESLVDGEEMVRAALRETRDKRIVVLDKPYPWEKVLSNSLETLFVVEPEEGDVRNWKAKAVRTEPQSFDVRHPFPISWAGKAGRELSEVSEVPDALFCHNQRFIAVAKTKEGALALAKRALETRK
ncbi:MAG: hypothetical protein UX94_C0004G0048 [Parcubacteria group bacterium GW2011_GWA2_47_21]|nr:MAG: hypothetical protein UX94_C0004G0048 [Parcubacteria group bacterium GW2011_GWA2_47_21]